MTTDADKKSGDGGQGPPVPDSGQTLTKPPCLPAVPPQTPLAYPPPPPGMPTVNVAFAHLAQPNTLASMPEDLRREVFKSWDQGEQRQFEHAMERIRSDERQALEALRNSSLGRKQYLVFAGVIGGIVLLTGAAITVALIVSGKPELGHTVMMSGLACIGTLLGGIGLRAVMKSKDD